jgi:hypothetical protein
LENVSVDHGISLLRWRSGRLRTEVDPMLRTTGCGFATMRRALPFMLTTPVARRKPNSRSLRVERNSPEGLLPPLLSLQYGQSSGIALESNAWFSDWRGRHCRHGQGSARSQCASAT